MVEEICKFETIHYEHDYIVVDDKIIIDNKSYECPVRIKNKIQFHPNLVFSSYDDGATYMYYCKIKGDSLVVDNWVYYESDVKYLTDFGVSGYMQIYGNIGIVSEQHIIDLVNAKILYSCKNIQYIRRLENPKLKNYFIVKDKIKSLENILLVVKQ